MEKTTEEIFKELAKPMDVKWRFKSVLPGGKSCTVIPYHDVRQYEERLDEVLGNQNWSNTYDPETGASSLSLKIDGEWIFKTDVGADNTSDKVEQATKKKAIASDGLKRACVVWGIGGRLVYKLGTKILSYNQQYKCAMGSKGEILNNGDKITVYMNGINTSVGLLYQIYTNNPDLKDNPVFNECLKNLKELLK